MDNYVGDNYVKSICTMEYYFLDYRYRIFNMQFAPRLKLLVDMLLAPENNDVYMIKIKWLRSWLNDQGIEI